MIVLQTFVSRAEAEVVKGLLEAHHIRVYIKADDQGGQRPEMSLMTGVHLMVAPADFEIAKKLIWDTLRATRNSSADE